MIFKVMQSLFSKTQLQCNSYFAVALFLFLTGCKNDQHPHSQHSQHHHEAPHGGAAVVLGEEKFHLEFVLDADASLFHCYVLDGHMERFVRIESAQIELILDDGEKLNLQAMPSRATGETMGDTSHFSANVNWEKGKTFEAKIAEITVKGSRFENIVFRFPEGNEKPE